MSNSVDLLAAAWTELRGQLEGAALGLLASTGHACPRILGSLDDMARDELALYFNQVAARAGVPILGEDDLNLIATVVERAGALRSHGIRRSAAVFTE